MIQTSAALGLEGSRLLLKGLAADPTAYRDLAQLARSGNTEEAVESAARAFESLLIGQILKQLRSASLGPGLFDSAYTELYQDLYDQQIAALISQGEGLGIRKALLRQLAPRLNETVKAGERDPRELIVPERNPWLRPIHPRPEGTEDKEQASLVPKDTTDRGAQAQEASAAPTVPEGTWPPRNAEEFIAYLKPYAEQAAAALGMDASLLLAQSALETGWGRAVPRHADGRSSFNLFGIKADRGWQGDSVSVGTLEYREGVAHREQARFRAYRSPAESFIDYVAFLKRNPRYREALQSQTPEGFIRGLQRAGYATDPRYADKVLALRARVLAMIQGASDPAGGGVDLAQATATPNGPSGAGSIAPSSGSIQVSQAQADESSKS